MSTGPLRVVLATFADGAGSLEDVASRTGLPAEVVRAGVDHLVRLGRIEARELAVGCPSSGCGGCLSGRQDGTPGCGAAGPSLNRRGPALVALTLRR